MHTPISAHKVMVKKIVTVIFDKKKESESGYMEVMMMPGFLDLLKKEKWEKNFINDFIKPAL
jgi:hypothetical protein